MSAFTNKPLLKFGAYTGLVAPILFTILVTAGTLLTPGYNQFSQTISELGQIGQPYALLQDANFLITGLLILLLVLGLYDGLTPSLVSRVGTVLLMGYPVAFILVGTVFPLPSPVHVPLGALGFFATLVGMIITSWTLRRTMLRQLASSTLAAGVVSIIGFVVYGFLQAQGGFTAWLGLAQRLDLAPYFVWVEILAVRLTSVSRTVRPTNH